jgi:hypothetical protein
MPLLSAFTPLGLFALSGEPSRAEVIYRALRAATGDSAPEGGHTDASLYARAMGMARAAAALDRAQAQSLPSRAYDLLSRMESEYELAPPPGATLAERRAALAARRRPPGGASRPDVERELRALLGTGFVAYVTRAGVSHPANPANGPGNFTPPSVARRKLFRLTRRLVPVGGGGSPSILPFEVAAIEPPDAAPARGDVVVISPDAGSLAERATVIPAAPGSPAFVVSVRRGHQAGALVTTQHFPYWIGTARHDLIVVTEAAARDAPTRRALDALLREILRGVSKWSVITKYGMRLDLDPSDVSAVE